MQQSRTPKFQLSGPAVHSLYCDLDKIKFSKFEEQEKIVSLSQASY